MKGYSHYSGRCMSGGVMHVRRSDACPAVVPRDCSCVGRVLGCWGVVFGCGVRRRRVCRAMGRFRPVGIQDTGYLLASDCRGSFRCAMYLLPLDLVSGNRFWPVGVCLTRARFRGVAVGRSSFRWTVSPCMVCYQIVTNGLIYLPVFF